jgi:hypothetical protein
MSVRPSSTPTLTGTRRGGGGGETPLYYRAASGKRAAVASGGAAACPEPVEGSASKLNFRDALI